MRYRAAEIDVGYSEHPIDEADEWATLGRSAVRSASAEGRLYASLDAPNPPDGVDRDDVMTAVSEAKSEVDRAS